MVAGLDELRFVASADVYKQGRLAGRLTRTSDGSVVFAYLSEYRDGPSPLAVASTLPVTDGSVSSPHGSVPAFFAGLLPEGRRLRVLQDAVKTSLDDELTLLLAVGADVPGDVQVVPAGAPPTDPPPAVDAVEVATLDFLELADEVDRHALPGVQDKLSAEMISTPVATRSGRYILKLDPPDYPYLVQNEDLHLRSATKLKIAVADAQKVTDRLGREGLLVTRFDRVRAGGGRWERLPLEDATQVLGLPPASKYHIDSERVVAALSGHCTAPAVAVRNLYLQFVFAWLTGNGDLHGKNVSMLGSASGETAIAPMYDLPCTLVYGDDSLALPVAGRTRGVKARHWREFAAAIGLPERAAASANAVALTAASAVDLSQLPFAGSPLRRAERELGFRRAELS